MADEAELRLRAAGRGGRRRVHLLSAARSRVPPPGATDHLIEVEPGVSVSARFYVLGPSHPTILFFHATARSSATTTISSISTTRRG